MEPDSKQPHTPPLPEKETQLPKKKGVGATLRALRTYRDDVASALGKNKTSLIDISVAEHKRDRKREKLSEKERELDKRIEEEGVKIRTAEEELKRAESTWLSWFKKRPKEKAPQQKIRTLHYETRSQGPVTPGTQMSNQQPLALEHEEKHSDLKAFKETAEQTRHELEQRRARLKARAPMRFRLEKHERPVSKYLAIIGTIILLVGGGIGFGAVAYTTFTNRGVVEPETTIPTFFPVNTQHEVRAGGLSQQGLMQALVSAHNEAELATGDIAHIYLTRDLLGKATLFSTFDLFDVLHLQTPDPLIRTLNEQFMLGVYRTETREPFLVLETSFFENAFPGMIAWEPFMNADLAPLFGQKLEEEPLAIVSPTMPSPFVDLVINNKDARVLYDEFGNIVLLYAFVDRNTIIITTTEEAFLEIFKRMSSSRTVR